MEKIRAHKINHHVTPTFCDLANEIQISYVNHRIRLARFCTHQTLGVQYSVWRCEVSVSISTYPPTKRLMPSSHRGPSIQQQQALCQVSSERSKSDHLHPMRDLLHPQESPKMIPIPDFRRIESGADHPHSNEAKPQTNHRIFKMGVIQHFPPRMFKG